MDSFFTKLTRGGLPEGDVSYLHRIALQSCMVIDARAEVTDGRHGEGVIHVLLDGWACQYRQLPDGRRQIGAIHLGGDVCDLEALTGSRPEYNVLALTKCRVGLIPRDEIARAVAERPAIRDMLFALLVAENRSLIEQAVNLGRRSAIERTASLLCDLIARLNENGEALDGSIRCPLTQMDMADHLGLSTVHTNRAIRELREKGLISGRGNVYAVSNGKALRALAGRP